MQQAPCLWGKGSLRLVSDHILHLIQDSAIAETELVLQNGEAHIEWTLEGFS